MVPWKFLVFTKPQRVRSQVPSRLEREHQPRFGWEERTHSDCIAVTSACWRHLFWVAKRYLLHLMTSRLEQLLILKHFKLTKFCKQIFSPAATAATPRITTTPVAATTVFNRLCKHDDFRSKSVFVPSKCVCSSASCVSIFNVKKTIVYNCITLYNPDWLVLQAQLSYSANGHVTLFTF